MFTDYFMMFITYAKTTVLYQIVNGMKQLKNLLVDGQRVRVEKSSKSSPPKSSVSAEEEFDRFSNNLFLKDNLSSDPAARFQILQNSFERVLNDAMVNFPYIYDFEL